MELLSSNIKKISGNGNPKKASYISGNGTFQFTPRKFLVFQETETPKKIPFISGNGNSEKILILPKTELSYILGNGTIFHFGKGIFKTLTYLELEAYSEP